MARSSAVWGIDIGNCSLKALRCYFDSDTGKVVADAFDFIEYPKILTQPDSEPDELIRDALQMFLSRNVVKGDKVSVSVAGQNGLTRFIKLPPVEPKRIPDLVKYEAKQQIPFNLKDVIWDYQRLGGESSGFAVEIEIGLFAMKREQVYHSLEPFEHAKLPVDCVQLTPMILYNLAMFDFLHDLPSPDDYDPENPPASVAILSMGTDSTDLVLTNGFKVWPPRSIPIGGNHFTKVLTQEMKMTFSKAEHLKRNANASSDKKAVFQAMRPVFVDFVDQIQRSLQFYTGLDRYAKISHIVGLGNPMLLAGLRKYLEQNLGIPVTIANTYENIDIAPLETNPTLKENLPAFGICYGLCLQGLGRGALSTNLLPREIVHARIINSKKPWAVAAASLMMLGCTVNFGMFHWNFQTTQNPAFNQWESQSKALTTEAGGYESEKSEAVSKYTEMAKIGDHLMVNMQNRVEWLELMRAITSCLPSEPGTIMETQEKPINLRNEVHILNIDAQPFPMVGLWKEYVTLAGYLESDKAHVVEEDAENGDGETAGDAAADGSGDSSSDSSEDTSSEDDSSVDSSSDEEGGSGPSLERKNVPWLIQITGYHYHNSLGDVKATPEGAEYVRQTILKNLKEGRIKLPKSVMFDLMVQQKQAEEKAAADARKASGDDEDATVAETGEEGQVEFKVYQAEDDTADSVFYSMQELGINHPILIDDEVGPIYPTDVENPFAEPETATPTTGAATGLMREATAVPSRTGSKGDGLDRTVELNRYDFVIQFIWTPSDPFTREKARQARLKAEDDARIAEEAAQAAAEAEEDAAAEAEEE